MVLVCANPRPTRIHGVCHSEAHLRPWRVQGAIKKSEALTVCLLAVVVACFLVDLMISKPPVSKLVGCVAASACVLPCFVCALRKQARKRVYQ